jgi:hypothetical protein
MKIVFAKVVPILLCIGLGFVEESRRVFVTNTVQGLSPVPKRN